MVGLDRGSTVAVCLFHHNLSPRFDATDADFSPGETYLDMFIVHPTMQTENDLNVKKQNLPLLSKWLGCRSTPIQLSFERMRKLRKYIEGNISWIVFNA